MPVADRSTARAARRVALRVGLAVLAAIAVVVGPGVEIARAGSSGERIDRYDVDVTIATSGDLVVTETIEYDFGANLRHGIIREIPVRYRWDDTHDRVIDVGTITVITSPGTPAQTQATIDGSTLRIRVGDPNVEISGQHRYQISYPVEGALNALDSHDELFWNATGNAWPVPIDTASVTIHAPAAILDVVCFRGLSGSTLGCESSDVAGETASSVDTGLGPFEGISVAVALPKGAVSPEPVPILEDRWTIGNAFSTGTTQLFVAGAVLVVGMASVLLVAWRTGRDRQLGRSVLTARHADGDEIGAHRTPLLRSEEVPVELQPPEGLRPGQVGTIVDETAHPLDVTATIVDLAVRGYLRIEEVEEPRLFRKGDWRLVDLRETPDPELLPYESALLAALFKGRDDGEVLLSELRTKFATRMRRVQDALYEDAVARGWFLRRPDRVRIAWAVVGSLAVALAAALTIVLAVLTTFAWTGVAAVLVALTLLVSSRRMPSRTPKGRAVYLATIGFRRFIEESEIERARFAEQRNLFTEYLPYAIVFGATDEWADRFDDLAREGSPAWFVGDRPFETAAFARSMSDFSVASAGTLTSTPAGSGSSGFSGGGSSGGGVGGGGGGSW